MKEKKENNLVFALDIGTRSIVGVVGEPDGEKLKILAVEEAEHGKRTMIDGQIDNIQEVANLARTVTHRLEERLGISLKQVCVAAAGRALQTKEGTFTLDFPAEQVIDEEIIGRLEAGAVSNAEEFLQTDDKDRKQLFLVGYTVSQYRLDHYPLTVLRDHKGKKAEVDVVATFLPGEVVESLYAVMKAAGLQVISLTLEPIAAMNAAIPSELRLLNLALVDIGAGTTDIAVCRNGSVVGYTMATIAGDEITEAIMQEYLVDFSTAESMKRSICEGKKIVYTDILGFENEISYDAFYAVIKEPMSRLADAISQQIIEVNTRMPSAVFLAGGGSKLYGLKDKIAASLGMDEKRVAITGKNFEKGAYSENIDLANPEYATPLGIAISVGLGLLNDSYHIILNGESAKLFRSGTLTVRDVLLMNSYTYQDMIGKMGQNLVLTLNGRRVVLRGEPAMPAVLLVNGKEATIGTVVAAGDRIDFTPAVHGKNAVLTLGDFLIKQFSLKESLSEEMAQKVLVNNQQVPLDTQLKTNDVILTLDQLTTVSPVQEDVKKVEESEPKEKPEEIKIPTKRSDGKFLEIVLNDKTLVLPPKADGQPYYLMDLLEHSGIDFEKVERPVRLAVNGQDGGFSQVLKPNDRIEICCID